MQPDEDRYEGAKTAVEAPKSLQAIKILHGLINQLEERLKPVLRPTLPQAAGTNPEVPKSELMQELVYMENHLNSIIDRLHV